MFYGTEMWHSKRKPPGFISHGANYYIESNIRAPIKAFITSACRLSRGLCELTTANARETFGDGIEIASQTIFATPGN